MIKVYAPMAYMSMAYEWAQSRRDDVGGFVTSFLTSLNAVETIPKVTSDIEAIPLNLLPKALRQPRKARAQKADD